MKSVKKIFVAFFALFVGIMLVSATTKAKAYSEVPNSTPWILTFDDGSVVNIREGETGGFSFNSNGYTVTYFDATGKTEGGYLTIWTHSKMLEAYETCVYKKYILNGESITIEKGGHMTLVYEMPSDEGDCMIKDSYYFYVNRSIIDTNRIWTDFVDGKYYYDNSIRFEDRDNEWIGDSDIEWEIYNKTTGKVEKTNADFCVDKVGEYKVTAYNEARDETLTFEFAIDYAAPLIYLVECDYLTETPMENGAITSAGMKVIYGDNFEVKEMTYQYKPFSGRWETGTVKSGFTFYRKGEYTITVTDMVGNTSVSTFTITDYDLVVDPEGAGTVGTEVTSNGGAYGDSTMSVGYTRCIYLGPTAPSQSRLQYTFTSSDESIATVSVYGTVEAKGAGTVEIKCVHKKTGKVSKIVITVLP